MKTTYPHQSIESLDKNNNLIVKVCDAYLKSHPNAKLDSEYADVWEVLGKLQDYWWEQDGYVYDKRHCVYEMHDKYGENTDRYFEEMVHHEWSKKEIMDAIREVVRANSL